MSFLTAILLVIAYMLLGPSIATAPSTQTGTTLEDLVSNQEFKDERGPLSYAVRKILTQEQSEGRHDLIDSRPIKIRAGNNPDLDPGAYNADLVEREIDARTRTEEDKEIERAFPSSEIGESLRRYVLMKRYPDQIPGAARLEADYSNAMIADPAVAIQAIAQILEVLPKSKFREEHVTLRELADRLPEGHEKLQALVPDPDFK